MSNIPHLICLSVAAPAFNESEGIAVVIEHWHTFLTKQPDIKQFEIIVCNDGSTDNTGEVLNELARQYPEIRPLHFHQNQGAAAALSATITHTQFEWVLLMDSDDQFPIENWSTLMACQRSSQATAVLGIRHKADHILARLGSWLSGFMCNLAHGTKIKDFNSACKLISGSLLRSFVL